MEETPPAQKRVISKARLAFMILLFAAGIGVYLFASSSRNTNTGRVLGESVKQEALDLNGIKKEVANGWSNAVKATEQTTRQLVRQLGGTVTDTVSETVDQAKEKVVDAAVENVVNQVKKLPPGQQKKIKEFICK